MAALEAPTLPTSDADAAFGLSSRALVLLRGVFASYPSVDKAIVYGSRAKGNYRPGSDIDMTLEGSALTLDDLFRIETALDDLMLPWNIDLSLISHIDNPTLLEHIARLGKVLWAREGTQTGMALSVAAVLRPAGSPLMPLR